VSTAELADWRGEKTDGTKVKIAPGLRREKLMTMEWIAERQA